MWKEPINADFKNNIFILYAYVRASLLSIDMDRTIVILLITLNIITKLMYNFVKEKTTEWLYGIWEKRLEVWHIMTDLLTFSASSEVKDRVFLTWVHVQR